jgi:glucose 1-dehydrogenase
VRAAAIIPSRKKLQIIERPQPEISTPSGVLMRVLEVGVCGTDRELCSFVYGTPPRGRAELILGHEALCEVVEAGPRVGSLSRGDLVIPSVRLPCSDSNCMGCASGHQDFCQTGLHREHGIKQLDGFLVEYAVEDAGNLYPIPSTMRDVAVLTEPLTIAEKGYLQFVKTQSRLPFERPKERVLVLGAGPVALLGAMKFRLEKHPVWIYSRESSQSPNALIAEGIGATYISSTEMGPLEVQEEIGQVDVVYEALGAAQLAFDVLPTLAANGIYLFTGIPRDVPVKGIDPLQTMSNLVLMNQAIVGIVNAGLQAYENAVADLVAFKQLWPGVLSSLITQRYPLTEFAAAITGQRDGIKTVIEVNK